jgi:pimeloyl-ACP methyl ester carboxylesterase
VVNEANPRILRTRNSTPAYVNRIRAIEQADYTDQLEQIAVPTLILTPEEDRLIGKQAAETLLNGIAQASEVVLPKTGHMFRFSHPAAYSHQIRTFLDAMLEQPAMT